MCVYVHVGGIEERKESRGSVCRLTNITVLRLFFLFTTLLRCVCLVWWGEVDSTDAAGDTGRGGEGGEVRRGRDRDGSSVFSSVSDSRGGGGPRAGRCLEEPPRLIVIMDDPWWQRQVKPSSHM